jgi:DNA-binding NarL/FixJ family response regulator
VSVRLVIGASIRLYLEGLAYSLRRFSELEVVGLASTRSDLIALVGEARPDVILLDRTMPDSLALVAELHARHPTVQVVTLGVEEEDPLDVLACAEAGATAYVGRDASIDELVATIARARDDQLVCSPRMTSALFRRLATLAARSGGGDAVQLTGRERQVAHLLDDGLSNKEIAARLGIGVATVKNHVHNLLEKLSVHRRGEAARAARRIEWGRDGRMSRA